MADSRTIVRAPFGTRGVLDGSACCLEPAPTSLERFGFGGEDEPPSCGSPRI
ncbi:hypothetical protein [Nocardia terpenica]|uniref:Uncharacterized protein n=1 Tax=Nocardia terpenica TaxID=455432 RepID=A0A6G9Z0W6_9NOCA|nr:hypothetical protein [Nocardia terpenica]QIS19021.1 hypothetical protein F6W96_12650 [Nocardia terpenica]